MATYTASVKYDYIRAGSKSKTGTSRTISGLKSQSETLVMQKLEDAHKDCQIILKEINWK